MTDINGGQTGAFATDADRENFAFLSSSASFRQNVTSDEREAFFGALQWQPNDRLDINLDYQYSERDRTEERSDLEFQEFNGALNNANTVFSEDGILESFVNEGTNGQEIRLNSQNFDQVEEYNGIGLSVEYQVNDDLQVSGDISYSNTIRTETELAVQLGDNGERLVSFDRNGGGVPIFSAFNADGSDFDPTDISSFVNNGFDDSVDGNTANLTGRQRFRSQVDIRENTITALRGDFELQTHNLGAIKSIEGGVRFSELEYDRRGNVTTDTNFSNLNNSAAILNGIANNCVGLQPESDFLGEELGGRTLGGNFDDFLSIDVDCAFDIAVEAGNDPDAVFEATDDLNGSSIDVEETTFAAYLQANYESTLFGLPARGNFGLRLVNTSVDSTTFISPFELDDNGGNFELDTPSVQEIAATFPNGFDSEVNDSFSYTNLLPSATLVLDLSDNVLFRSGIFRGISRSDPAILGERQQVGSTTVNTLNGTNATTQDVVSLLSTQTTTGGAADLEAFTSWNIDAAIEWYPNKDTVLAAGVYYKKFRGGFQNTVTDSQFIIINENATGFTAGVSNAGLSTLIGDNGIVNATVPSLETTDESSNLYGIELTASHAFSYLPGFWGGFGAKLSYNYASSDFEFEDDFAGEGVGFVNGEAVDLVGLIPSADIFGLSRNVASAQLYWSGGAFDFQLIGKHRSQYFQQFVDNPGRLRFVDDTNVLEFRASYKLNDSIKFSFEALNITDENRTDFRAIDGNVNQVLSFGPRYFFGIKATL